MADIDNESNLDTLEDGATMLDYSSDVGQQDAPPPLPARDYTGTVRTAVSKTSQAKGSKYVNMTLHISPDQYPADYADFGNPDGETLSWNRTPIADNPQGRFKMKQLCGIFGIVASRNVDLNQFIGQECKVTVGTSTFEGEIRAEIKKLSPID